MSYFDLLFWSFLKIQTRQFKRLEKQIHCEMFRSVFWDTVANVKIDTPQVLKQQKPENH